MMFQGKFLWNNFKVFTYIRSMIDIKCINDKSNYEGTKIDCFAIEYELKQVINEPTHLLENSSSCIDLIFTSQPNLVMDAGIHPSLHASCHHQIVYAKFNSKINYPPSYEREV